MDAKDALVGQRVESSLSGRIGTVVDKDASHIHVRREGTAEVFKIIFGNQVKQLPMAEFPSMLLSTDPVERKNSPITTGVLDYFPLALAAVAQCSKAGNDQHNPGQPLHWAKEKSTDHADCIARHLIDRDSVDTDGIMHAAKLAWRALAFLQIKLENEKAKA